MAGRLRVVLLSLGTRIHRKYKKQPNFEMRHHADECQRRNGRIVVDRAKQGLSKYTYSPYKDKNDWTKLVNFIGLFRI